MKGFLVGATVGRVAAGVVVGSGAVRVGMGFLLLLTVGGRGVGR